MDQLTQLCSVLLLSLCLGFDSEETTIKTIGREPDVTPICTNATEHIITLIVCKIRTEMKREECRLIYQYGQDFKYECDSRFSLKTENQTVFLHLTSLTPADSGNYTCECSYDEGTEILHLNITVEDVEDVSDSSNMQILTALIGGTILITIIGVIFGFICIRKLHGYCSRSQATSGTSVCETPGSFDEDDPDDPYTSLQQPDSDLYQTISNSRSNVENICFNNQEIDGGETDQSSVDIYENI